MKFEGMKMLFDQRRKGRTKVTHPAKIIVKAAAAYDCIVDDLKSRTRKFEQIDKWSFCLTAGTLCLRIRRDHEQTTAPEPHPGLQCRATIKVRRQRQSG